MWYRKINPPDHLSHIIRFYWILETEIPSCSSSDFHIIADNCPGLIYHHGGKRLTFDAEGSELFPKLFLYGQTTMCDKLYTDGRASIIGVIFYPHVLKTLFGFDAVEVTDKVIDVELIAPELPVVLQQAQTPKQCIEAISSFLTQQIQQPRVMNYAIRQSIEQIGHNRGNITMRQLYRPLQLSERQFERRFKQHVGIPPKLFARITRFKSALNRVHNKDYQLLSDIAFDHGYADQSHFIREFKEFSGLKPSDFHSHQLSFICQAYGEGVVV